MIFLIILLLFLLTPPWQQKPGAALASPVGTPEKERSKNKESSGLKEKLSQAQARRIALAAQGFGETRPVPAADRRQLNKVLSRTGLFQIDSVSVVVRAHYMPLFSRLGPYPVGLLDAASVGRKRRLFEYWAHEASLLPVETYPLMRWRMARAERGNGIYGGLAKFHADRRDFVDEIFRGVERNGPIAASDIEGHKGAGGWWGWSEAKHAFEWLFWAGRITTAHRRGFERVYDLPERVLPHEIVDAPVPTEADAQRELLQISARALGVATAADLRDYFRLPVEGFRARVNELLESGELLPVSVGGWSQQAYLHRDARWPRRIAARALLAPFDPLVWERSRAERLFDFHYRIEIYTPAHKRQFGYYVLPFLLGDRIVARVDIKADRGQRVLRVLSTHAEDHAPPETATELAEELRLMAAWLELERIEVSPVGDLAAATAAAVAKPEPATRSSASDAHGEPETGSSSQP